jgi:hypothetical protein
MGEGYVLEGYFFHGKMPGCCLPSLTAATALHFTAGYLKLSLQQEPTLCFAFLGGSSPLPIKSTVAIILSRKKYPDPSCTYRVDCIKGSTDGSG